MLVAREQIEIREAIELKGRAIAEAQRRLDADNATELQLVADDRRSQHSKLVDQLEKEAITLERSIKRSSLPYARMLDLEKKIREMADGATGFAPGAGSTTPVGAQSYGYAIAQISKFFPFKNMPFNGWLSEGEAAKWGATDQAFASLFFAREQWRNPEPQINDDVPVNWVEVASC
jgi:hypothetical protein